MDKYTDFCPVIFPLYGTGDQAELDRIQSIDPNGDTNWEKQREVGSDFTDWGKNPPSSSFSAEQHETGNFEPWKKIANVADDATSVTEDDFEDSWVDIANYITDDNGTFLGTLQLPKLRVTGFSIDISDPESVITRSYDLEAEDWFFWENDNQYLVMLKTIVSSGDLTGGNLEITVGSSGEFSNYPNPVADPDVADSKTDAEKYIQKIMKVTAGGTSSELTVDDDYSYDSGTKTITVNSASVGDTYKVFYTASSYRNDSTTPFVKNTSKSGGLYPDCVTSYLYIPASGKPTSDDKLLRVQGITIETSLDRADYKEVGNKDVVLRGVNETTVSVTINRYLESLKVEEVLRGKTPSDNYGKIDLREIYDNATLVVDVYSDNSKTSKVLSYKVENLAPTGFGGPSIETQGYSEQETSLEGTAITITNEA